jgi:hypothetical protein
MPSCGSCRATLSEGDRHVICVSCLGEEHAALALADGGRPHCELLPMVTLRTRLASFSEPAFQPAVVSRRKKRRAQRAPELSPARESSPVRPPASPVSLESLPDGQRPLSAAASAPEFDEPTEACSLVASDSEDWASSVDLPPAIVSRQPSGKRAGIETELMRLLSQAVESIGLDWEAPAQQASSVDLRLLSASRQGNGPASRPRALKPRLAFFTL